MATATWYLVRYTNDFLRREPRNVGVVLQTHDGLWLSRFLGSDQDNGKVDGRSLPRQLGIDVDTYREWIDYFTLKMGHDWGDALKLGSRRRYNYSVEMGGQVHEPQDWATFIDQIFLKAVAHPRDEKPRPHGLKEQINTIFIRAEVEPLRDVPIEASYRTDGQDSEPLKFPWAVQNGRLHLMDQLPLRREPEIYAQALRARIDAANRRRSDLDFVVFFANDQDRDIEHVLRPVEEVANFIDVANPDLAAERVQEIAHHF